MKVVQKQQTVTKQQTMVLLKNMMRISVSSICFMRDLFPDDCFDTVDYGNTKIHQLKSAEYDNDGNIVILNQDAFLLTQWLEKGVFAALAEEFLKAMTFTIFMKHPEKSYDIPLESYEFKLGYGNETNGGGASMNGAPITNKEQLKTQASKFIRSLVEFTNTLDDVPDDRWITLSLSYTDKAPDNFEPQFFQTKKLDQLKFHGAPLKVKVGCLKANEQELNLKYTGLESLLMEDICNIPQRSHQQAAMASMESLAVKLQEEQHDENRNHNVLDGLADMKLGGKPAIVNTTPLIPAATAPAVESAKEQPKKQPTITSATEANDYLAKIREFVCNAKATTVRICAKALNLSDNRVESALNHLARDGVLKKTGKQYIVFDEPELAPVAVVVVVPPVVAKATTAAAKPTNAVIPPFNNAASKVDLNLDSDDETTDGNQLFSPPLSKNKPPLVANTGKNTGKRSICLSQDMSQSQQCDRNVRSRPDSIIAEPIHLPLFPNNVATKKPMTTTAPATTAVTVPKTSSSSSSLATNAIATTMASRPVAIVEDLSLGKQRFTKGSDKTHRSKTSSR